jgi:hypothetical protein
MHLTLGWTAAIICFYMSVISPAHMASQHYVYNTTDAANFAAFVPITWCLFTAWIIFISYIGYGGMYPPEQREPGIPTEITHVPWDEEGFLYIN